MNILTIIPEARLDLMDLRERASLAQKAHSRSGPLDATESARLRELNERWGDDGAGAGGYGVRLAHLYHPLDNLSSHHAVMMDGAGVWHYKCVLEDWLHDGLSGPSRGGVDSQRVVDRLLGWFGAGRLAHVQGAPVGAAEGGGDALLAFEDAP